MKGRGQMKRLFSVLTLWLVVLVGAFAWAETPALPGSEAEALALFKSLWSFAVEKNWAAAFGPLITLLVWALRKWDEKIPKVGPAIDRFLNLPFVAFLLPTAVSAIGGFGTALLAGQPIQAALAAVWAAASSAIATYIGLKKIDESLKAGAAEAKKVETKADAISELKKP